MSAIHKLTVQPLGASSAALTHSAGPLSAASKAHLGQMLAQMAAAWPAQELPEETAQMYQLGMEDLAEEFGVQDLRQALRHFLTRSRFFPHPSEIREELEAMAKRKQEEAKARREPLGPCGICDGVRMVLSTKPDGERVANWCECVLSRRRKEQMAAAEQMQMGGTK